ncbi:MFS transporter [Bordetella genomosp. 13]|uniref:MFS transporter n=1 Tax=Bordetella genomosp. 13 TaxID=463040 RepID=UPI0011A172CA|nr:MFS transporter [Bordetella genomosp. 13]
MSAILQSEPADAEQYGWRVLSVTTLGVMLCFINASTLNVALPMVADDLNASPVQASWILLSYMLLTTVLILVFGRLADLLGRKRLYLAGLAVLVAGSVGCGLSQSAGMLLAFRCVQAIGAAAVITNTTALLADAFPVHKLGLGLGLNATISAAAQSMGPVIGGVLVDSFGWRSIFLINLPLGALALAWAGYTLRQTAFTHNERFDVAGAGLSMVGVAGLVYALSMGGPNGWLDAHVLAGAAIGIIGMMAFVFSQRRREHPLVDLSLFDEPMRSASYACVMLISMANVSTILLVSLYLQAAHGYDAVSAGLAVAPTPVGMMLASPVSGRLIGRHSHLTLCLWGLGFAAAGVLMLACVTGLPDPYVWMAPALFCVGVGNGLFLTPNNSGIMQGVRPGRRGIANGIRSALQNTGLVIGTALALSIATAPLSHASQKAAYAGRLSMVSQGEVHAFTGGCRTAFAVLFLLCSTAIAVLLWARGRSRAA